MLVVLVSIEIMSHTRMKRNQSTAKPSQSAVVGTLNSSVFQSLPIPGEPTWATCPADNIDLEGKVVPWLHPTGAASRSTGDIQKDRPGVFMSD